MDSMIGGCELVGTKSKHSEVLSISALAKGRILLRALVTDLGGNLGQREIVAEIK
jgi:hypothetical protein